MPIEGRDDEFRGTITAIYRDELGRDPEPAGLAAWLDACRNGLTGDQLRQAVHDSPEGVAYRARPKPAGLPDLSVSGIDFIAKGQRVVLKGVDQFMALRTLLDGGDLKPLIQESQELGFDLWRVFGAGSKAQNGMLELHPSEPGYYHVLEVLALRLRDAGIRLLFTAYVDNQDVKAGIEHWLQSAEALRPYGALLSAGNEFSKNGFDPGKLPAADGILWSRGSDVGDAAPFRPYGSFAEFHPRRDMPAALMDAVASPVFIYGKNGLNAPLIIDEPPRMGADGSGAEYADPRVCWRFARHYATECAGAVFHSRCGQSGRVMDPTTRACAEAWQRGMQI